MLVLKIKTFPSTFCSVHAPLLPLSFNSSAPHSHSLPLSVSHSPAYMGIWSLAKQIKKKRKNTNLFPFGIPPMRLQLICAALSPFLPHPNPTPSHSLDSQRHCEVLSGTPIGPDKGIAIKGGESEGESEITVSGVQRTPATGLWAGKLMSKRGLKTYFL